MRIFLAVLLSGLGAFTWLTTSHEPQIPVVKAYKLKSFSWDVVNHVMYWQVEVGYQDTGNQFHSEFEQTFRIEIGTGIVSSDGTARLVAPAELPHLHRMLDVLSAYAGEITMWFFDSDADIWDTETPRSISCLKDCVGD